MSEDELNIFVGHSEVFEQGGRGMSQVVQLDAPKSGFPANPMKRSRQVARLNGLAGDRGEHQALVAWLSSLVRQQRHMHRAEEAEIPPACRRLDRTELQCSLVALKLLADMQHLSGEVHIAPAQAEHFATTQAVEGQQQVAQAVWMRLSRVQEGFNLSHGPGLDLGTLPPWQFDQTGDVPADQFFPHCAAQG